MGAEAAEPLGRLLLWKSNGINFPYCSDGIHFVVFVYSWLAHRTQ